jgi:integrase
MTSTAAKGIITKNESVIIDFVYRGVRCRETIRVKPTATVIKDISRKREAILYEIDMGTFDYANHFPNSKNALKFSNNKGSLITIEHALKLWLKKTERRCQYSTMKGYNGAVYAHLIPAFGNITLDKFSLEHLHHWLNGLNVTNKRINNVLSPLRQVFYDAFCDGLIDKNPMDRFRNFPIESREPNPFKPAEVASILEQLEGQNSNLIQFAFWTGMRTSEYIALTWDNVDFERKRCHVRTAVVYGREKTTKTKSGLRTIELQPQALDTLRSQQTFTSSGCIFLDDKTGRPWKDSQAIRKRIWIPALERAGIEYRNPYQTRHTFASTMLSRGENPMWVAQQMGHKDWGMIRQVYGRWIKQ